MEHLVAGELRIEAVDGGPAGPILLHFSGKSTDRFPGKILEPYFKSVLAHAAGQKSPVEAHFEGLDYFNSSTVSVLVKLVQDAGAAGINLSYVYDHTQRSQKLSFEALRVFERPDGSFHLRSV